MNEAILWIISGFLTIVFTVMGFFLKRFVKQIDENEKKSVDRDRVTNERITINANTLSSVKEAMEKRSSDMQASILGMKESILASVAGGTQQTAMHISGLAERMARDYLPRSEHRQDLDRIWDELKSQ